MQNFKNFINLSETGNIDQKYSYTLNYWLEIMSLH